MAHHTARREQFRRYLEKASPTVRTPDQSTEHLLFFLVALYEDTEKPNNASDFIKHQLGVGTEAEDAESLRLKLNTLQQKYDQLMEENKELRSRTVQAENKASSLVFRDSSAKKIILSSLTCHSKPV
uniref:MYC binding protein n=1 Tax=Sinocyclocheilus rhinocerous TaxID=307959 RepID=A0A673FRV2_9TELE